MQKYFFVDTSVFGQVVAKCGTILNFKRCQNQCMSNKVRTNKKVPQASFLETVYVIWIIGHH